MDLAVQHREPVGLAHRCLPGDSEVLISQGKQPVGASQQRANLGPDATLQSQRVQPGAVAADTDAPATWGVFIERPGLVLEDGSTATACACGCSQPTVRAKATFRPGHDQRLMGTLQFAHREGLDLFWTVGGGLQVGGTAAEYGALVLSDSGQDKLARYLAAPAKKATAKTEAAPAPAPEPAPQQVRVGRWTYEVVSVATDGAVTYRDRQGAEKTTSKGELVAA